MAPCVLVVSLIGNACLIGVPAVANQASPAAAAERTVKLNDCHSPDNGDPELASLVLGAQLVDVRSHKAGLPITVRATDTGGPGLPSGISSVSLGVQPATRHGDDHAIYPEFARAPSGDWVGIVLIRPRTLAGAWRVDWLDLRDAAGNTTSYDRAALKATGVDLTFEVLTDFVPMKPVIEEFTVRPTTLDTSLHSGRFVFTVKVAPHKTRLFGNVQLGVAGGVTLVQVPGRPRVLRGSLLVPRGQGPTSVYLYEVYVSDGFREATLSDDEGLIPGAPETIEITGEHDLQAPRLTSLRIPEAVIDLRTTSQTLILTARARDSQRGVASIWVNLTHPDGSANPLPDPYSRLRLVRGDRHRGVWRGKLRLPRCMTRAGRWDVTVDLEERFFDPEGLGGSNSRTYRAGALRENGWLPRITVLAHDNVSPTARFAKASTTRARITFDELVTGLTPASMVFRNDAGPVPGQWECRDDTGAVLDCETGWSTEAMFAPDVPLDEAEEYRVAINPEHQLSVMDAAGNPPRREVVYINWS